MDSTGSQSAGNRWLDWLAGIIDGEGSLSIAIQGVRKPYHTYKPIVSIANTHKPTIDKIQEVFKVNGVGVWICKNRAKPGRYRIEYSVFVCGLKRVNALLDLMQERLFTKRAQANLRREFIVSRLSTGQGHDYSSREHEIVFEIRGLNNSRYQTGSSETLRSAQATRPVKIKSNPHGQHEGSELGIVT